MTEVRPTPRGVRFREVSALETALDVITLELYNDKNSSNNTAINYDQNIQQRIEKIICKVISRHRHYLFLGKAFV